MILTTLLTALLRLIMVFGGQGPPDPGTCYCVDSGGNVTAKWQGCTDHKTHSVGACFQVTGNQQICPLDIDTYQVQYGPDKAWITNNYLNLGDESKCSGIGGNCSRLNFVSREEWGAREPVSETSILPPLSGVFVHHSAMNRCFTPEQCIQQVQEVQDLHMDVFGWDDIGYNFLVGEDGRVYEGRGWEKRGAHARQHNDWSYGICILGNFMEILPNEKALMAIKDTTACGVDLGKVTQGFELFGHRDGVCTECPGQVLYEEIQTWNYYSTREIPIYC